MLAAADDLVKAAMHYALGGDMAAMRLVFDRIMPAAREDFIEFDLPRIERAEDCAAAQAGVLAAVACGQLLPSEGQTLTALIEAQRRAYETTDLAEQMRVLSEEMTKLKEKRP